MHDFWKSWLWWFFFLNDVDFFYSLKMNKAWANAPSLEHEFMSLEKNLIWLIFENNYASDDFLKTSELDTLEYLSLIKKRKYFWMIINLKKKFREHEIAWNCMNVRWRGYVPLGTRGVPFSTFGVPISAFRVPNGTWPRHNAHAMVGRLCTLFQCMFYVSFFEKHLHRLSSWNSLLVYYKLFETYFKPD